MAKLSGLIQGQENDRQRAINTAMQTRQQECAGTIIRVQLIYPIMSSLPHRQDEGIKGRRQHGCGDGSGPVAAWEPGRN